MKIREITDWNKKDENGWVDELKTSLNPLINKRVLLSGGGSWDTNVCVLKEIVLVNFPDGSRCVDVILTDIEPVLFGEHEFEARLGSWHISEIIEVPGEKKYKWRPLHERIMDETYFGHAPLSVDVAPRSQ